MTTESGTTTATNTTAAPACIARASTSATGCSSTGRSTCPDHQRRHPLRGLDGGSHRGLAAGGDRHPAGLDHRPGRRDGQPRVHRRHQTTWATTTVPLTKRGGRGARAVRDVPLAHGRVPDHGHASCTTSTGPSSAATASRSSRRAPTVTPAARWRPRWRSRSVPRRRSRRSCRAWRTRTPHRRRPTSSPPRGGHAQRRRSLTDGDRAPRQWGVLAAVGAAREGVQPARDRRGVR